MGRLREIAMSLERACVNLGGGRGGLTSEDEANAESSTEKLAL